MNPRIATGWWRDGAARDREGAAVSLADLDRLFIDGARLDDAFVKAWLAPSSSWPFLVVRELNDDDAVARATALLSAWVALDRGLELIGEAGRPLT